jgi:glycosyltransferase involved in cell wall biosynthesis
MVSFVMPVRNEEQHLASAVESVLAQELPKGYKAQIVLAVAPSSDATEAIAKELATKHKELRVVQNPSGLTSAGLNLAINSSTGEVAIRVDAHSELQPGYVLEAIRVLELDPKVGNVGGVMLAEGKTDFEKAVAWAYRSPWGLGGGKFHVGGEAGEVETVYLGSFRREALIAAGLFDESIVRGQDWELNQRLRKAGWKVFFTPNMKAEYRPRKNLAQLAEQFYRTGLWRGKLSREGFPNINLKYLAPPALVLATVFVVPLWVYLLLVVVVALSATELNSKPRNWLLAVLPTMHYLWGIGFLLGFAIPSLARPGE